MADPPPSYSETVGGPMRASAIPTMAPSAAPVHVNVVQARTSLYGPNPVEMDCPYCQSHIVTSTERVAGALPWIIMGVCFLLGFFLLVPWCICFIPFCVDGCLDVLHSCPICKRTLGRHNKI
uniref:LITAF domain-containing protein n=2 Tax=Ascarididae TaxID=6250 RepID=A0A915ABQ9_PARUN